MKSVIINGDTVEEADIAGYEQLQEAVDGNLEMLPYPGRSDVSCYINEEGKILNLPYNNLATDLLKNILRPSDYIVGPMVVIGFDPDTGEEVDLSEEILLKLLRLRFLRSYFLDQ
jgi:hypothetical protein